MKKKLKLLKVSEKDPGALYLKFHGQTGRQPVYLEIDPKEGTMLMDSDAIVGPGMPGEVWSGIVRQYRIPFVPTAKAANKMMRELKPLAQKIADGHSVEWNGQNWVGVLTEEAEEAERELEATLVHSEGSYEELQVYEVEAWFEPIEDELLRSTKSTTELAKKYERQAKRDGVYLHGDIEKHINWVREQGDWSPKDWKP